jgi:hypothetical protein
LGPLEDKPAPDSKKPFFFESGQLNTERAESFRLKDPPRPKGRPKEAESLVSRGGAAFRALSSVSFFLVFPERLGPKSAIPANNAEIRAIMFGK